VELATSIKLAGAELSTLSTFVDAITEPKPVARLKFEFDERSLQPVAKLRAAGLNPLVIERRAVASNDTSLGGGLRRMLTALAQRNRLTAQQLGVRAGLSSKSGTFGTYLGRARSEGWISGSRERLEVTQEGRKVLGSYDPLPEGRELQAYWLGELGGGAARMLEELCRAYPRALTAEELGERAELSAGSGTFGTYLGKLRTLELVTGGRGDLRASEELF
jgi:hypothetical protein